MTSRCTVHCVIFAIGLIGGFCMARSAHAQLTPEASPAVRPAKKTYSPGDVNLERSRVYIHVDKTGLGHQHAIAGMLRSGHIDLTAEQHAGEIVFDLAGFVADPDYARKYIGLEETSDPSTKKKVTDNMLGPDVLNVAKFPFASCTIVAARATGKQSKRQLPIYEFSGQFTLHGTTRPIRILADVEQREGWIRLQGNFTMLQTDYGITPFSKAFGAIGVANRLTVYGDIWIASDNAAVVGAGQ